MQYPTRFSELPEYAFPRLRALLDHHQPGGEPLAMSIGEPTHKFPDFVEEILSRNMAGFNKYPPNDGTPELRSTIAHWLEARFELKTVDPDTQVMSVNGTREGLFNAALALCPETKNGKRPAVLLPNPFYQCYMVAALTAGAEPVFVNATAETGFLPDYHALSRDVLERTALVYICSPSNPQGAVASADYLQKLMKLAEEFDFKILADECYSEIYRDTPPAGALSAAKIIDADPERVLVFHSLSKRSNLPGLRSGFVASGPNNIAALKQLRAYTGAPVPLPLQQVSAAVWSDEGHVERNRDLYRKKFALADKVFGNMSGYIKPQAGFFLWLPVDDGESAALKLWQETGVRTLPGAYLSQDTATGNPGAAYLRVAMVAPEAETMRGFTAIRDCIGDRIGMTD